MENVGTGDLYENKFEKYPHPRSSEKDGYKSKGRREEDRVKELQEVIQKENRQKTLGKQNTVAVENPSLEVLKSKATTTRASSLSSSGGCKQSLKRKKGKERFYETDIISDEDIEIGNSDSGESVEDNEAPVVSEKVKEPYGAEVPGKSKLRSAQANHQ